MGVLACDRAGCDSVMCDYRSDEFGYLCYSCREELFDTQGELTVMRFMSTPKRYRNPHNDPHAWNSYINNLFQNRNDY